MKLVNTVRKRTIAMLMALALVLNLLPAQQILADSPQSPLSGQGTEESPYLIHSRDEWITFSKMVNSGQYSDKYYRLAEDITSSLMLAKVGTSENPFKGVFDGNRHTITINTPETSWGGDYTAFFGYIGGAVIKNVIINGSIRGSNYTSGLVAIAKDDTVNRIENCWVKASIQAHGKYVAGILAVGNKSDVTFQDCLFSGYLQGADQQGAYFYGWNSEGGKTAFINCLAANHSSGCRSASITCVANNENRTITNCYTTRSDCFTYVSGDETGAPLKEKLGDGWILVDKSVLQSRVIPYMKNNDEGHEIKIHTVSEGSVQISEPKESYQFGDYIYVIPKAEDGYVFDSIKVNTLPASDPNNDPNESASVSESVSVVGGNQWYSFSKDYLPWFRMPAENVEITPVFIHEDELSVDIPRVTYPTTVVHIPEEVTQFHVYDDGGKDGNYSPNVTRMMEIQAPKDYYPMVTGTVSTLGENDYLQIFQGTYDAATKREKVFGDVTISDPIISESETMTLRFVSDGNGTKTSGFDLCVELYSVNDILAKGSCGDSIQWTLTNKGELTVSGNGAMPPIPESGVFWKKHIDKVKTVKIKSGITEISEGVFAGHTALTDLYLDHTWAESRTIGLKEAGIPETCNIHYADDPLSTLTLPEHMSIVTDAPAKYKEDGKYKPDAVITFGVDEYYEVKSVSANGIALTPDEGVYTVNMEDQNVVVTGDVNRIQYNINYVLDADVTNQNNPDKVNAGEGLTLSDPVREGYIFKGWFTDEDLNNKWVQNTKLTQNSTFYAKWLKIMTYDEACYLDLPKNMGIVEDADADMKISEKYRPGAVIKVAVQNGYTAENVALNGQTLVPDKNGVYTIVIGETDAVVTAKIKKTEFTVIYHVEDDVDLKGNPTSVVIGEKLVLTDPEKEGFVFRGWFTVEDFQYAWDPDENVYGDVELYAKFLKPIPYIDENGKEQICDDYTILTDSTRNMIGDEDAAKGWYVVDHDVTISEQLTVASKTVKLLLCDGVTLTAKKGIKVAKGTTSDWSGRETTLNIYAQSQGADSGSLKATGAVIGGDGYAGIGGSNGNHGCHINIFGGDIYAEGAENASGLGGGGRVCDVNIYGGNVVSMSGENGSGIGGTDEAKNCAVNLIGGTVVTDSYMGTVKIPEDRYIVTTDGTTLTGTLTTEQINLLSNIPVTCTCRVGFNTVGGTKIAAIYNTKGSLLELTETPTKEGFVFAGWYKDSDYTEKWNVNEDLVTESMMLYAKWAKPIDYEKVKLVADFTYNGEEQMPSVIYDDIPLVLDQDYTIKIDGEHKKAGSYICTITFIRDYTGELSKIYRIEKKKLQVSAVTVADKVYDGTQKAKVEEIEFTGKLEKDDVDVVAAKAIFEKAKSGKGIKVTVTDFAVTGDDGNNYKVETSSFESGASILPCPVSIKAVNQSVSVNSAISTGVEMAEVSKGSLADGQVISDIVLTPAISTEREGKAPIYPADAKICDKDGNDTTSNYEITYVHGWMKVVKGEPAKVDPDDKQQEGAKDGQQEGAKDTQQKDQEEEQKPTTKPEETKSPEAKAQGTVFKAVDGSAEYVVTSKSGETPAVTFKKLLKAGKKATVPATVTIDDVTYQVTGIAAKAFANKKTLTNVTIEVNVVTIGKEIFKGCKKLKNINVKTENLTAKTVKAKAFKGLKSKVKVKVPKAKKADYKKFFNKKGLPKTAKIK